MKKLGQGLILVSTVSILYTVICWIYSHFEYETKIGSYWELADKSSTLDEKLSNINKFVDGLEESGLRGEYNAVFFKTPNNSFDSNIKALKTLQSRLVEIEDMDVTSFEYQTAMQQITAQEQGEADAMTSVFCSIWYKHNYVLLWDWVGVSLMVVYVLMGAIGGFIWDNNRY